MLLQSATNESLHTQRFIVCELPSNACHEKAGMTAVAPTSSKEETRRKPRLSMVATRHCTSDCRLSKARYAVQPEYTALLVTVNPLVYLFESIFSSPRQTV
jgi:hypothetical protein